MRRQDQASEARRRAVGGVPGTVRGLTRLQLLISFPQPCELTSSNSCCLVGSIPITMGPRISLTFLTAFRTPLPL